MVDLIGIEREAFTAFQTNSKPSEAGLNLRGGPAERTAVFDDSLTLAAETESSGC